MTEKWQLALTALGLADQDFGPTFQGTYAELAAGWRGPKQLPSEAALLATNPDAIILAKTKANAILKIDTAAETARGRFITPGAGQALVYERKRAEATAFAAVVAAGGAPVVADYPLMNARALRLATTLQAVADDWNARSVAWVAVAAQIENTREAAKEQVAAATAAPAIDAIVAALSWPVP
jgi:hypothetical protein